MHLMILQWKVLFPVWADIKKNLTYQYCSAAIKHKNSILNNMYHIIQPYQKSKNINKKKKTLQLKLCLLSGANYTMTALKNYTKKHLFDHKMSPKNNQTIPRQIHKGLVLRLYCSFFKLQLKMMRPYTCFFFLYRTAICCVLLDVVKWDIWQKLIFL